MSQTRYRWRLVQFTLSILLAISAAIASANDPVVPSNRLAPEVIDVSPDEDVGWGLRNAVAIFASMFPGGREHWYAERMLEVDTTPTGGFVDVAYLRRNVQKRFEQARAPVTLVLPPRIRAGQGDAVVVTAFLDGYRQQSITVPVATREPRLVVDLEPLPNRLSNVSHRYFAGRSTLVFLTDESPTFRVVERPNGFGLVLSETAPSATALESIAGIDDPIVRSVSSQQMGEDLVLRVETTDRADVELRTRLDRDAARDLYAFSLDLIPTHDTTETIARTQAALARLQSEDISGCNETFERELRAQLDPGALARSLAPRGSFADAHLRAAMRRLGALSPGGHVVGFAGGVAYKPSVPIELEAALREAAMARGYLALLRSFVRELGATEQRREALRSLIAPELNASRFAIVMDEAEAQEQDCITAR